MADPESADPVATHPFSRVPIEIAVTVGHARPTVRELLRLGRNAVLSLDRRIEDPVDLYVGDQLIARGELTESGDNGERCLAVRLTEVVNLKVAL